jgi:hypothetical protein
MRKWLARLPFSFLVIAIACAWEAYRGEYSTVQRTLLIAAAAVGSGAFLAGMAERHRAARESQDENGAP